MILNVCRVQDDVIRSLKMAPNRLFIAVHPFNRANLYYEVRRFRDGFNKH